MDTNWGKYNHDILIRLNLRTSKIYVLDMQEMCSTPEKCWILLSWILLSREQLVTFVKYMSLEYGHNQK